MNRDTPDDPQLESARAALGGALGPDSVVIVISGPGGVGKGTVVDALLARDDKLHLNRSWTTRARRPGEPPDAYCFVSREAFEHRAREGGFLEWVEFLDYLQGSPVPDPPEGHDVVFEIDVAGGERMYRITDDPLLVFIDAPDRETQAERMRHRGDSQDRIDARLRHAEKEVAAARELPYVRVVNDDLDTAVAEVESLIADARRARR